MFFFLKPSLEDGGTLNVTFLFYAGLMLILIFGCGGLNFFSS